MEKKKQVRIVMDAGGRSVAYVKIDTLREETTRDCRISGVRTVGVDLEEGEENSKILEGFVPGGFM